MFKLFAFLALVSVAAAQYYYSSPYYSGYSAGVYSSPYVYSSAYHYPTTYGYSSYAPVTYGTYGSVYSPYTYSTGLSYWKK